MFAKVKPILITVAVVVAVVWVINNVGVFSFARQKAPAA